MRNPISPVGESRELVLLVILLLFASTSSSLSSLKDGRRNRTPLVGSFVNLSHALAEENAVCESVTNLLLQQEQDESFTTNTNGTYQLALMAAMAFTQQGEPLIDPGWHHLAATLLAVDHFNERNPAICPDLAGLKDDCPIRFDYDKLRVMDTGIDETNAMNVIMRTASTLGHPHAIAGPYNEIPGTELGIVASTLQIPLVSHRGVDHDLLEAQKYPFVSQVNPDLYSDMEVLADYLHHIRRDDYIAILYESSLDMSVQRVETFRGLAFAQGIPNVRAFGYISPAAPVEGAPDRTIANAVAELARSGYRTIVWVAAFSIHDAPLVGEAAHQQGLDRGDHVWIVSGGIEYGFKDMADFLKEGNLEFMYGSAYLVPMQLMDFSMTPHQDPFMKSWLQQNASFVQRVSQLNPIPASDYQEQWRRYHNDSAFPPHDIFAKAFDGGGKWPAVGTTYMYDSVMSIGMGACMAYRQLKKQNRTNVAEGRLGEQLLAGIRSVDFRGATGRVSFGDRVPGSRKRTTVYYGVYNMFPQGLESRYPAAATEYRNASTQEWTILRPFVYGNGLTQAPLLLRDIPDQNYLSPGIRIVGLLLMSIALVCTLSSAIWVVVYRHNSVVLAAQPSFLLVLCLGSAITASAIAMISFDESYGWSEEALSKACVAFPWLIFMGHMLSHSALFTKLWRINKVLQPTRRRVGIGNVVWPPVILNVAAIVALSIWTATSNYGWKREIIDPNTGETLGQCQGGDNRSFIPIPIIAVLPTLLAGAMAFKTTDIAEIYAESKWILALILVQCQVILVATPLVIILQGVSTDGRYIGETLIFWTFPMTTQGLMMIPKMLAVHKPFQKGEGGSTTRGSNCGEVRITGLDHGCA